MSNLCDLWVYITGSSSSPGDKRLNHSSSSNRDGERYSSSSSTADRKYKDDRGGGGGQQQRKEAATKRDVSFLLLCFLCLTLSFNVEPSFDIYQHMSSPNSEPYQTWAEAGGFRRRSLDRARSRSL